MSNLDVAAYLVRNGFVIAGNEIYGGRSGYYDYGHLGVLLKKKIQRLWERYFVDRKPNSYYLDATIFTSGDVWKASGHMENFNDILVDCKDCKKRYREDHLPDSGGIKKCPNCGASNWTEAKPFNLIFRAQEDHYLRPETAQSIFINFKGFLRSTNAKIPFCICQVGKAFRNEVTISNFIFRTKEFEQMECEWFIHPNDAMDVFTQCQKEMEIFLVNILGIKREMIKVVEIPKEDRAHYSSRSSDVEFEFPHGWGELWGLAYRSDFDLLSHQNASGKDHQYLDPFTNEKYVPHVVEHSIGLNRLLYAVVSSAYEVEQLENGESRELLRISKDLAPYLFSILPLTKNEKDLAQDLFLELIENGISSSLLDKGSIGKRYRKNDLIGTPYCITLDQETSRDNFSFTVRDRDSMLQKRISLEEFRNSGYKVTF
ncbi:glycyl-tRNA synthetase [Mycoplasma haemofelis str. Langford 1]|uniref:Glycyl-tRNA synthetase n=2 Tax=Mycoplasma haemofelis TaxID=29501 RepID=F6FII4_MYCHI|nr:glycine--tRNA ligase [Mycoplasma haemofelis]AEG73032.1 glycyl-tRNA synthetase [Mycoplasma haemofelis Ohio2]CBY92698.1 glycyl-tRNA synthetase [Mycoplasma haemofelis str. Langford 1]